MFEEEHRSAGYNFTYATAQQYPSYFDETLSDDLSLSDQDSVLDSTIPAETPSIELDRGSHLLNFSRHNATSQFFDYLYRPASINLSAQLSGKFCLAANASTAVTAIICYRRNLFTIGGSVTLPRSLQYLMLPNGEYASIESTELLVSAIETLEYGSVRLLTVPLKGSQASGLGKHSKGDLEPSTLPLTPFNTNSTDPDYVSIPFEWKRLQFRVSTANNGRRKELQQHFYLSIRVIATLKTGQRISIFETKSEPIVVRGRSPRNFQPKSIVGSITGRRSRATTVESSLALSRTNSGSGGSFEHMALPMPSYNGWHNHSAPNTLLPGSAAVHSVPELEQYALHRSPGFATHMHNDEDYFGSNPSKRPRSSDHQSPRTSPFSPSLYGDYLQQSSYEYLPPMADAWSTQPETLQLDQISPSLAAMSDSRSKISRMKPTRHHSNGRH